MLRYSNPRECAGLLLLALADITFSYSEERIYDDEEEIGLITSESIKYTLYMISHVPSSSSYILSSE